MSIISKRKSILIGFISAAIFIQLFGCAGTRPDLATEDSGGGEIRIYEVFGMDCPGCHGGVEKLINKIPGVSASQANWEKQQLVVVLIPEAKVNDDIIYAAIKDANFTPGKRLK